MMDNLPKEPVRCLAKYGLEHITEIIQNVDQCIEDLQYCCNQRRLFNVNCEETYINLVKREYDKYVKNFDYYGRISLTDVALDKLNDIIEEIFDSYKHTRQ